MKKLYPDNLRLIRKQLEKNPRGYEKKRFELSQTPKQKQKKKKRKGHFRFGKN